jgi:hypothetical protein
MRFRFRKSSAAFLTLSIGFCCSCEKHSVGELPAADNAAPAAEAKAQNVDGSPVPSATVSATPVEFFPRSNPR